MLPTLQVLRPWLRKPPPATTLEVLHWSRMAYSVFPTSHSLSRSRLSSFERLGVGLPTRPPFQFDDQLTPTACRGCWDTLMQELPISARLAMKFLRRKFLQLAAGAAALPALSPVAGAQTYP